MPSDWLSYSPMTNEQALALLHETGAMSSGEYYAMSDTLRRAGFTMAKVKNLATLSHIKQQLARAAAAGWSPEDFASWLESSGATWERNYSRLVYHNAVQNSYNDARFAIQQRTGNLLRYPALLYVATIDAHTSDFCHEMNGRWWWRNKFPRRYYPPNHHYCRSIVRMVKKTTARRFGSKPTSGAIGGLDPDWNGAPPNSWENALRARQKLFAKFLGVAA